MSPYDNYRPEISDPAEEAMKEALRSRSKNSNASPRNARENSSQPKRGEKKVRTRVTRERLQPGNAVSMKDVLTNIVKFATGTTLRLITGIFMLTLAAYLLISVISFISEGMKDSSEIANSALGAAANIKNTGGEGGARLANLLINESFGLGAFVIILWLSLMGLKLLTNGRVPRLRSVSFTIKCLVGMLAASLVLGLITIGFDSTYAWGGLHGQMVNEFIIKFLGWSGAALLCIFAIAVFVVICLRDFINWLSKMKSIREERRRDAMERERRELERESRLREAAEQDGREDVITGDTLEKEDDRVDNPETVSFNEKDRPEEMGFTSYQLEDNTEDDDPEDDGSNTDDKAPDSEEDVEDEAEDALGPMKVNVNHIQNGTTTKAPVVHHNSSYKFPPFALLNEGNEHISVDQEEQIENKERIRQTLLNFGIQITGIEATVGPTVTLYEIVPDQGVRIAKIRSLVDDIAMSLAAEGVRIIAPIPGKGTVGIEVANKDPQIVSMRPVIASRAFQEFRAELPVGFGATIDNRVFVADLAKMPHLLVAGATGQGKSVGLNTIITSLLYSKQPDELKFVLIDPKMVEFSIYSKIENHYLAKLPGEKDAIITDPAKVVEVLSSLCVEMTNRYAMLKAAGGVRKITEYNKKIKENKLKAEDGHKFLPYIVVVIDEFADLIMTAKKSVEMPVARLAQLARAVGIHVIVATQRPSTNVITGVIKANFPARIAFRVSSGVDSKTILDQTGAQQLIGKGDMLILQGMAPVRIQCAFVDTPEVEKVVDHISHQPFNPEPYILPEPVIDGEASFGEDYEGDSGFKRDALFDDAAREVVSSGQASTSWLQRKLSVGYTRAGKIMDQLERAKIVGPAQGAKPRAVLVDFMALEEILANQ